MKNRNLTAADIQRDPNINKKGVSVKIVERVLNNSGLKCRMKRKMQHMTP